MQDMKLNRSLRRAGWLASTALLFAGAQAAHAEGAIGKIVAEVLARNPDQAQQMKDGNPKVVGWLVGQVMKASQGKANPALVNKLLKEQLGL